SIPLPSSLYHFPIFKILINHHHIELLFSQNSHAGFSSPSSSLIGELPGRPFMEFNRLRERNSNNSDIQLMDFSYLREDSMSQRIKTIGARITALVVNLAAYIAISDVVPSNGG
ncbi:hypothetical protein LINGRAPRIM_LOCUS978, partial [Linum grandiflorum]